MEKEYEKDFYNIELNTLYLFHGFSFQYLISSNRFN